METGGGERASPAHRPQTGFPAKKRGILYNCHVWLFYYTIFRQKTAGRLTFAGLAIMMVGKYV
jgi:hypothetical protein